MISFLLSRASALTYEAKYGYNTAPIEEGKATDIDFSKLQMKYGDSYVLLHNYQDIDKKRISKRNQFASIEADGKTNSANFTVLQYIPCLYENFIFGVSNMPTYAEINPKNSQAEHCFYIATSKIANIKIKCNLNTSCHYKVYEDLINRVERSESELIYRSKNLIIEFTPDEFSSGFVGVSSITSLEYPENNTVGAYYYMNSGFEKHSVPNAKLGSDYVGETIHTEIIQTYISSDPEKPGVYNVDLRSKKERKYIISENSVVMFLDTPNFDKVNIKVHSGINTVNMRSKYNFNIPYAVVFKSTGYIIFQSDFTSDITFAIMSYDKDKECDNKLFFSGINKDFYFTLGNSKKIVQYSDNEIQIPKDTRNCLYVFPSSDKINSKIIKTEHDFTVEDEKTVEDTPLYSARIYRSSDPKDNESYVQLTGDNNYNNDIRMVTMLKDGKDFYIEIGGTHPHCRSCCWWLLPLQTFQRK
ncbi:hypothetical protein TVAG_064820 [Trichomonas vaginalis G3]|uniref:Uncharacterized protein n=1 Tax=Trichomonas vaginalis (strain ATCC PRA-98 / G3) TaxID=412133 RepID=A2EHF6_TRIV3|nr:hypothetical protein TVAGG3_0350390 [Trichomonas vaginalis G3]EAY07934.1 hypothetical protein TVAG_064820 [Trichomonas vaginalis G3]KAI5531244.1 hypothetical protein TVAGG3_0350390 [Trichomonas vaginalis G3]|eukprot:XP_001320157.1 hypothetical protein [Trichomonas vaginalis G3]